MKNSNNLADHQAVELTAAAKKYCTNNPHRTGLKIQNQEATATIFYRSGGNGAARSFLGIPPGGMLTLDIHAPNQELWMYSDVSGAIATVVEEFEGV